MPSGFTTKSLPSSLIISWKGWNTLAMARPMQSAYPARRLLGPGTTPEEP